MKIIRRFIVAALVHLCTLFDAVARLPLVGEVLTLPPWYRHCRLADWSGRLEERWDTGVWDKHSPNN